MAVIAFGVIVWFAYLEKTVHWAVYWILAWTIFQATKDDLIEVFRIFKWIKDINEKNDK